MTTIKLIQKFLNQNGFHTRLTNTDEPQPGTLLLKQDPTSIFATARVSLKDNTIHASIFNRNDFTISLEQPDSLTQLATILHNAPYTQE